MIKRHTECDHLFTDNRQPMCCINGEFFCGPCAAQRIGELVSARELTIGRIASSLDFTQCGHFVLDNEEYCHVCFEGICAWLTLVQSHARLQAENNLSNRMFVLGSILSRRKAAYRAARR